MITSFAKRAAVASAIAIGATGGVLGPTTAAQASQVQPVSSSTVSTLATSRAAVSGTLEPGKWTKVLWGWFVNQSYYVSTSPSPVKVREYPFYREYTLPLGGGCVTLNAAFYGDVWLYSENGADYYIGSLC